MAKNLREKIPKGDTLFIQDVNSSATTKFVEELADYTIVVAKSAREVAENAVSSHLPSYSSKFNDEILFSFFQLYELKSVLVP
jgi:hypothetical protein